jgi:hypothetical protein
MHCIQLRNGSRYPPKCRLRDSLHALKRYTEATAADKKRPRNGFHHYRSTKRYGIQLDSATDNAGTPNVFWTNGSLHGKSTHACKVILNHYRTLFNFSNQCRGGHMIISHSCLRLGRGHNVGGKICSIDSRNAKRAQRR